MDGRLIADTEYDAASADSNTSSRVPRELFCPRPGELQWRDIGDAGQLLEADNRFRALAGLPPRNAYSLD